MRAKYDFSGWATKNDLKCSDGRTIRKNAFAEQDGQTVPLVWQHASSRFRTHLPTGASQARQPSSRRATAAIAL